MTDYDKGRLDAAKQIQRAFFDAPSTMSAERLALLDEMDKIIHEPDSKKQRESFWNKQIGKRVKFGEAKVGPLQSVNNGQACIGGGPCGLSYFVPISDVTHIYEPVQVEDMPDFS